MLWFKLKRDVRWLMRLLFVTCRVEGERKGGTELYELGINSGVKETDPPLAGSVVFPLSVKH